MKVKQYIIKNCPAIEPYCTCIKCYDWDKQISTRCKDVTDCLLKQIVEKCKEVNTKFYDSVHQRYLSPSKAKFARQILELLEIEEVDE